MARPRLTDRDAIAAASLSVRLTSVERARWDAFVAKQNAAFRGTGARVTAASLARDVLVARLDAEGIPAADTATPAAPTQQGLPFDTPAVMSAEAPAADPPSPPAAPVKEEEGGPFWRANAPPPPPPPPTPPSSMPSEPPAPPPQLALAPEPAALTATSASPKRRTSKTTAKKKTAKKAVASKKGKLR